MNVEEAKEELINLCATPGKLTSEGMFIQDELCKYIYDQTNDYRYLEMTAVNLESKNPQLAEKIYKLSIENGDEHSCLYLANLYYKGLLGKTDYEKAFLYYTRASMTEEKGDGSFEDPFTSVHNEAKLKLAEMYRNGLYVNKDLEKYGVLVNEVYEEVKDKKWYEERYYGLIAKGKRELEKGNQAEGLNCLLEARTDLATCFDCAKMADIIESLKEVNDLIYSYIDLDYTELDAVDITELLKNPVKVSFRYNSKKHYLKTYKDKEKIVIEFENQLFTDVVEFIMNAKIGNEFFKEALFNTERWEVVKR